MPDKRWPAQQGTAPEATVRALTRELASYAARSRFQDLPETIRIEAARAFLNWVGCVLGGCREPAVAIAAETAATLGGGPQATILGRGQKTDIANAAFVNCISSSVQAFDDAHLATVTHPSGPAGAAVLAYSERFPVSGEEFLSAFALGIEIECRLANMLLLGPAQFNLGLYVTGLTGPIGVALALGNLMRLDEQRMAWAIGLAASTSSGFRATHGTMAAHFRPGHATRAGVWAAMLAANGFDCTEDSLEADKGFADVFTQNADLDLAVAGLGQRFELLSNAYKPYPCGIVIHPTVDACLDLRKRMSPHARITKVVLRVNPLALKLTGIRVPTTPLESHVSLFHWAAAVLLRGSAGLQEIQIECITDPAIAALRASIHAVADPDIGKEASIVEVTLADGTILREHVTQARGSTQRPMTDDDLEFKFRGQARMVLPPERVETLLQACRNVAQLGDVGREIVALCAV